MAMRKFEDKLAAFPAFFKVEGEKVAIFGNGDLAKIYLIIPLWFSPALASQS
jgi:hypothetical protein